MNDNADRDAGADIVKRAGRPGWATAVVVTTLVFMFGSIFGAVLTAAVARHMDPRRFDAPQFRADRLAQRLGKELNLTDEQSTRIREIFHAQHDQLEQIRQETEPRVREVLDQTHDLVMAELSEQQRAQWDAQFDRLRRRMRAPGWDGPPRRDARPRARPGGDPRRMPDPERMIERQDKNGDGKLDLDEVSSAWERLSEERFRRLDHNGDGFLDANELGPPPPEPGTDLGPEPPPPPQ